MKFLIAEDDFVSRKFIQKVLSRYGECDVVVDGLEALDVFLMSLDEENYYNVVFLDIMMPNLDGLKVLENIRKLEKQYNLSDDKKVKIVMTTALDSAQKVMKSFEEGSQAYAVKPLDVEKILKVLENMGIYLEKA